MNFRRAGQIVSPCLQSSVIYGILISWSSHLCQCQPPQEVGKWSPSTLYAAENKTKQWEEWGRALWFQFSPMECLDSVLQELCVIVLKYLLLRLGHIQRWMTLGRLLAQSWLDQEQKLTPVYDFNRWRLGVECRLFSFNLFKCHQFMTRIWLLGLHQPWGPLGRW